MNATAAIRQARLLGWTPINLADLPEYHRSLDYEMPGDDEMLAKLGREAEQWLKDNQ